MPEFLEIHAEQAIGSNYGPAGGQFASKDIRVSPHFSICFPHKISTDTCFLFLSLVVAEAGEVVVVEVVMEVVMEGLVEDLVTAVDSVAASPAQPQPRRSLGTS